MGYQCKTVRLFVACKFSDTTAQDVLNSSTYCTCATDQENGRVKIDKFILKPYHYMRPRGINSV
jgi:hypothetical protein